MATRSSSEFTMHGARAAIAAGLVHIEAQVSAIESAVFEEPSLAFDLARTLVESTCRTILTERSIPFDTGEDLPRLFKTLTLALPLLPPDASGEVDARRSIAQTLGGLQAALQGICELRNAYGFASHGAAGARAAMEPVQAMLAAQSADTIVGFLHRAHCGERGPTEARLRFEDNAEFNVYLDETNEPFRVVELEYRPSEALFNVDQEAYRDVLTNFSAETIDAQRTLTT
jgi:Abortive infection C-terminus